MTFHESRKDKNKFSFDGGINSAKQADLDINQIGPVTKKKKGEGTIEHGRVDPTNCTFGEEVAENGEISEQHYEKVLKRKKLRLQTKMSGIESIQEPQTEIKSTSSSFTKQTERKDSDCSFSNGEKKNYKKKKRKGRKRRTETVLEEDSIDKVNCGLLSSVKKKEQPKLNSGLGQKESDELLFQKNQKNSRKKNRRTNCALEPFEFDQFVEKRFKFNDHALVRDYVPRKLIVINGLSKQMYINNVDLKVPEVNFKGSSINSIAGYGYA